MQLWEARTYSGTLLNGHYSTVDTHDIADNSESLDCPSILQYLSNPWTADTLLFCITDNFHGLNCMWTILNDNALEDTCRSLQQDCRNMTLD